LRYLTNDKRGTEILKAVAESAMANVRACQSERHYGDRPGGDDVCGRLRPHCRR
jgi:hypothetical protein